jgi:two-component system, chemotaxis family, chemotaxis protein CheY
MVFVLLTLAPMLEQGKFDSILVVDDEADLANAVQRVLTRAGYDVSCAASGKQAITLLQQQSFAVVVTDMLMPDVDGAEVIAAVRRLQPRARIVAISGGGMYMGPQDILTLAKKLGADTPLPKPFTPSQLLDAVGHRTDSPAAA